MKYKFLTTILIFTAISVFTQHVPAQSQADREKAQALYKQGLEQIKTYQYEQAYDSIYNAWQLDKNKNEYKWQYMHLAVYMGQQALFAHKHEKALNLFTTAIGLKREFSQQEDQQFVTIKRFIEITEEHKKYYTIKPDYVHKFQVIYIMHTNLKNTFDHKNRPVSLEGSMPNILPVVTGRYHEMLRIYIEALSRGRMSLSFDNKKLDATVTRLVVHGHDRDNTSYLPDFDSVQPSMVPLLFSGRNTYDSTIYYWYAGNLSQTPLNFWGEGVTLVPYALKSNAPRSKIILPGHPEKNWADMVYHFPHHWLTFHEFFHTIEYLCGFITPVHAHLPENIPQARKNYPDWVPDTHPLGVEYSWYKYHLQNTVLERMEKMAHETSLKPAWRNMSYVNRFPDTTDENLIKTYGGLQEKIPLSDRQKAADLVDQGFKLIWVGKHKESQNFFEQAYKHNPFHHETLYQLGCGALYYHNNDFARADRYYREMARVFPDPKKCFDIGKTFVDYNQNALAAHYLRLAADRPGANPVYAWWAARSLAGAGDAEGAEAMMRLIEKHQVVNAPVAFLICRAVDVAPCTGNRPEEEAIPAMLKPYRSGSARWRLVPAGAGKQVRIVSDYNWLCLEVRTKAGAATVVLAPIGKNDSQVWQMERGKDGSWRVVSKTSNLSLAVVPAAAGKQTTLSLRTASADPLQKWDIETHDPAVGIADTLRTAALISPDGLALDVSGGKFVDGNPICQWDWSKDNWNQKWKLVPSGTAGHVLIISAHTLKCVAAVENDGFVKPLQQTVTKSDAQLWKLVKKSGGRFMLVNKLNGMALQPDPWKKNDLMLGPPEDSEKQLWKIEY